MHAKLTPYDVKLLRHDYDAGLMSNKEIAEKYGISLWMVIKIGKGRAWQWVK